MGARGIAKRSGRVSKVEQALVTAVVADSPRELDNRQITGLATSLRRSKDAVKEMVDRAREELANSADEYRVLHLKAVKDAGDLTDDPKALDAAMRGAQWALEHISIEGHRIVDTPKTGVGGPGSGGGIKIMFGINMGDKTDPVVVTGGEVVDAG